MKGLIIKSLGGFYTVASDNGVYECKPRGIFRKESTVLVVGDRIDFEQLSDNSGVINTLEERKNLFSRPPVSNIDKLFIVLSAVSPAPDTFFADKMTVICKSYSVTPIIIINKADLEKIPDIAAAYTVAGFDVITASTVSGEGIEKIRDCLSNCICAFAGFSGVGKSSLITSLLPESRPETGTLSLKIQRGKNTTRHVELFPLPGGGYIADTPGFSSLDILDIKGIDKNNLADLFPEFSPFLGQCQFTSCSHRTEKGCAVLEAVADGRISGFRHDSYLLLYDQLKNVHQWNK